MRQVGNPCLRGVLTSFLEGGDNIFDKGRPLHGLVGSRSHTRRGVQVMTMMDGMNGFFDFGDYFPMNCQEYTGIYSGFIWIRRSRTENPIWVLVVHDGRGQVVAAVLRGPDERTTGNPGS